MHGDFRLGNLLAVGAAVTAVIDWEIWSVGDPRVDLGWFLANADPDDVPAARRATRVSCRRPATSRRSTPKPSAATVIDVEWFRALACFKSTATWSLIVKHNRRRAEPDPEVEQMAAVLPHLLERARAPAHLTTVPVSAAGCPRSRSATFASASALSRSRCSEGNRSGAGL